MKKNSLFLLTLSIIIAFLVSGSLIITTCGTALAQLKVITVPWYPPDPSEPHNAYNGNPTIFKAIARGGTGTYTYEWDFNGDGVYEYSNTTTDSYNLSTTYTYPNQASEKTFFAKIRVTSGSEIATAEYPVTIYADPGMSSEDLLKVKVNVAIDDGLWYLHTTQTRYSSGSINYGYWTNEGTQYSGYYTYYNSSPTASTVQAFEIHGHLEIGDYDTNPYVETVARGLRYMFTTLLSRSIGNQVGGNPDTNGNGIGIYVNSNRSIYELGQVMDAIAATGDPNHITTTGGSSIIGRKYRDILQDMVDMYAWGMVDSGTARGGWRYNWNSQADNSAAQWGAIGMLAAEEIFDIPIPNWIKTENNIWLNYSYDGIGFGYTSKGHGAATTPGGMVQLAFDDFTNSDSRWTTAENYIANNWNWWKNLNNYYAYYAFVKAMREAQQDSDFEPEPIKNLSATGLDWYADNTNGLAIHIVNLQNANGNWPYSSSCPWLGSHLRDAFCLVILSSTLFERDAVARAIVNPTSIPCGGGPGGLATFDHSESKHKNSPENEIVLYKWDFDASDGIDWDNPDYSTTDPDAKPTYTYVQHGQYTATLQVEDDNDPPKTDEDEVIITATIENHKPVSDPDGPYEILEHEGVTFDASGSYDPDESCGDEIVEYRWDLDNDGITDDANGNTITLTWAELNAIGISGPGVYTITLMVVDTFGEEGVANTTLTVYSNYVFAIAIADISNTHPGGTINFDGTGSYHTNPARSIISWEWEFGDGNTATGQTVSHAYDSTGDYTVTLTVTDDNSPPLSDTDTVTVSISYTNHAPVADPDGPYTIEVGEDVTLDGTGSYDPDEAFDDSIVSFEWDLDNDGVFDRTGATVSLNWAEIDTIFPWPGVANPITLRVTDEASSTHQATTSLTIYENNPIAQATATPEDTSPGVDVTFDASGSYHTHPAHSIVKYEWDFGDGSTGSGVTATHKYTLVGETNRTFTVALTVIDDNDPAKQDTDTVDVLVTITNHQPVADPGGPYLVSNGESVTLDGSGSYDPDAAYGDVITYAWDIDADGLFDDASTQTVDLTSAVLIADYAFIVGTAKQISLQVTDTFGETHAASTNLKIYENVPVSVAEADNTDTYPGITINFDGTGSYHTNPDRSIVSWEWDFGDGNTASGQTASHAYDSAGDYTVTLTVTDNNLPPLSDTDTVTVSISYTNHAPVADPDGPYTIATGEGVTLDGTGSYDPDEALGDSIVSFEWDLDNDGVFDRTGATVSLSWAEIATLFTYPGVDNPITLQVTDEASSTHQATTSLKIYENNPIAQATATPNEVDINDAITFSASNSHHTHPDHAIISYEWDWETDGTYDATGIVVNHSWPVFGNKTVTLRVTDDNDPAKTDTTTVTVTIKPPNHPPTAVPGGPYMIDTGEGVTFVGSGSFDINEDDPFPWTDEIVSYLWDLDNDGQFDDATDEVVNLNWSELLSLGLSYPANPQTGEPRNTVRLQVTDTYGATSTGTTFLTIYDNKPIAQASATPADTFPGVDVTFDASGSYHTHPAHSIVQYEWDFGDGSTGSGVTATHKYTLVGEISRTFTVALTVIDDNDPAKQDTDTVDVLVTITNHQPVADPGGPYLVSDGESVTLDGSGSYDPDAAYGDVIAYAWDIDADGLFDDAATQTVDLTSAVLIADYAYIVGTEKQISLQVTDTFGETHAASTTLKIYENVPVAVAEADNTDTYPGITINFDGTGSYHTNPDRSIVSWEWDFGDGNTDTGQTASHAYDSAGDYTVTLTVTDNNSPPLSDTDTVTVSISYTNHAPVADPDGPYSIAVGEDVTLDGTGSHDPDEAFGDSIVSFEWDLDNDGVFDKTGATVSLSWAEIAIIFTYPGVANPITLQVTDEASSTHQNTTSLSIYYNYPIAQATATPADTFPGVDVTFDASGSSHTHPAHSIVQYEWDFGDGSTGSGVTATHKYTLIGEISRTFTVALTVIDDNDPAKQDTDTVDVLVTITNHQPVADPGGPYLVSDGEIVKLDGSGSYDPDAAYGDVITYAWDIDADGLYDDASTQTVDLTSAVLIADYAFIVGTAKQISLQVTDTFGETHAASTTLGIYENVPVAVVTATPQDAGCNQVVAFNGLGSYHTHPQYSIVNWEWDFDDSDGVDWSSPDAVGSTATHSYGKFGTYTTTLRVIDNNDPAKADTDTVQIQVTISNNAPVADANPLDTTPAYVTYVGNPILLDGSKSYDPDESCGDQIVKYEWDTDNDDLYGTDDNPDDLVGVKVSYINPAWVPGSHYTAHLRVTDLFGATDGDTATIYIVGQCIDNLLARPKSGKVQLTWTHDLEAECYNIYRSTSPNVSIIPSNRLSICHETTYATYLDYNVTNGTTYYYRVTKVVNGKEVCVSNEAKAVPSARTR